jgi:hopanoid biosynthesis associated RND transporter like protein HpnN
MVGRTLVAVVDACRRAAWAVVIGAILLTGILGYYAATHLSIDADTARMISPDLPWRKREAAYDALFPQTTGILVVVIDAGSSGEAEDAAALLAERMRRQPELFRTVRRPEGGEFFARNGRLFLPLEELQRVIDQIIEAQPLLGTLAADPSLRGVFEALGLALEGVKRGEIPLDQLEKPLGAIAEAIEAALAGSPRPVSWETLFTGRTPAAMELRRFILTQPVRDYASIQPGEKAREAVRAAARELGLTPESGVRVRLTGPVALADEEFATVKEGTGLAMVLSTTLVLLILFLGLRSLRIIVSVLLTLLAGLVATAAFAAISVGSLNLISVAFAVLFVGLAVDFGIQFCVRFRDERFHRTHTSEALRQTAATIGTPLLLAAAATAVGFYAFVPTNYSGVSELGIIAGTSMVIAVFFSFTLLPAFIAVLHPRGEKEGVGFDWAAPIDDWLLRRRRTVAFASFCLGAFGLALAPQLRFDFDPLNLKDPRTESVSTLFDLMQDPLNTPYTLNVLSPDVPGAVAVGERLETLSQVAQTVTLASFVPKQQEKKLAIIADAAALLGPTLSPRPAAPPTPEQSLEAMRRFAAQLSQVAGSDEGSAAHLSAALDEAVERGVDIAPALRDAIVGSLLRRLAQLRLSLEASAVTLENLPQELRASWVAADGRARTEVFPSGDARDPRVLRGFVAAVQAVAPDVSGTPISILESGDTVVDAFIEAGAIALVAIALLLFLVLRRPLDVALVLAPLALAALLTVASCVLLNLPINYANIIALPLLLGIGVSFDIYFVMNWRAGRPHPLQSPTARAVLFSALTTVCAFGSLAVSSHPGTSEMGKLLTIALGWTLATTLFVLPALLGPVRR